MNAAAAAAYCKLCAVLAIAAVFGERSSTVFSSLFLSLHLALVNAYRELEIERPSSQIFPVFFEEFVERNL